MLNMISFRDFISKMAKHRYTHLYNTSFLFYRKLLGRKIYFRGTCSGKGRHFRTMVTNSVDTNRHMACFIWRLPFRCRLHCGYRKCWFQKSLMDILSSRRIRLTSASLDSFETARARHSNEINSFREGAIFYFTFAAKLARHNSPYVFKDFLAAPKNKHTHCLYL